jgi:CheY-like chemotaxis protein
MTTALEQPPQVTARLSRSPVPLAAYFAILLVLFSGVAAAAVVYVTADANTSARRHAERLAAHTATTAAKQLSHDLTVLDSTVANLAQMDGMAAIDTVTSYPGRIDLLVSDVVMPRMLGREVADRISELQPDVRVLYISGYAQPVLGSQGTLDADVELLEKPFSEPALLSRVRDILDAPPA